MQIKTGYSVSLYPDGADGDEARVYFNSAEEKAEYIYKEHTYCLPTALAYRGAGGSVRDERYTELLKRRVSFALNQGFAPAMKDRLQWYFTINHSDPDSPKSYA